MKRLRSCMSQLLVTLHYLHISWHDMKLELTLGIFFAKSSWSMISSTWSCGVFKNDILVYKFHIIPVPNLLRPTSYLGWWINIQINEWCARIWCASRKSQVITFMTSYADVIRSHDVIPHLSRGIFNANFQIISLQEFCK